MSLDFGSNYRPNGEVFENPTGNGHGFLIGKRVIAIMAVVVAVSASALALRAVAKDDFAKQWSVAGEIKKLGGIVLPDDGARDKPLEYLDFAHHRLTTANVLLLKELRSLKSLSLAYTGIADETLTSLPELPELESLDLSFNPALTSRALESIGRMPRLKILHVEGTAIAEKDLAEFLRAHSELSATSSKNESLPPVARDKAVKSLRELSMEGRLVVFDGNAGIDGVLGRFDDDQLRWLSSLHELRRAFLNGSVVHGHGLKYLADNKNLLLLRMYHCPLADDELEPLSHLTHLMDLSVWGTEFGDRAMGYLDHMPDLHDLFLDATQVTDEGLKHLANLPHLMVLTLRGDRISDAGVARIAELSELQTLDLEETQVTDACIPDLVKLPALTQLNVTRTRITKAGVAKLKNLLPMTDVFGWTDDDDQAEARFDVKADGEPIDLLSKLDPNSIRNAGDAVRGKWIKSGGTLLSATTGPAWFPAGTAPLEYDLKATLERVEGTDSVEFILPINQGRVTVCLDTDNGTSSWLEAISGRQFWGGEGTVPETHILLAGRPHEVLCQVRRGGLRVYCDGKLIMHWVGDTKRLKPFDYWDAPDQKAIYLGSWNTVFRFTKVQLLPLSATGAKP